LVFVVFVNHLKGTASGSRKRYYFRKLCVLFQVLNSKRWTDPETKVVLAINSVTCVLYKTCTSLS